MTSLQSSVLLLIAIVNFPWFLLKNVKSHFVRVCSTYDILIYRKNPLIRPRIFTRIYAPQICNPIKISNMSLLFT